MNGEYDYLTDPEMGREAADEVGEGATAVEMAGIGHFPMSENPERFDAYLKEILADITSGGDQQLQDALSPEDVGVELN